VKKKVLIIGAGIGGLSTANLLAKAGYEVHVYEKDSTAGGRAGILKLEGFTFDTGPSWYLMPGVFRHYFELLDEDINDYLDLVKLKPAYKVFFEHQNPITIHSSIDRDANTFESIEKGAGKALRRYVERGNVIYQLSLSHFLYSNFTDIRDFLRRDVLKRGIKMLQLATTSIDRYVSSYVKDKRLKQILEYPMVFLGTSPFTAPAIYSLMSALDFKEGVFYPQGGMYTIIESLVRIGNTLDVSYHFNSQVEKILTERGEVKGLLLGSGNKVFGDIIISNADLHFTETVLLDRDQQTYPESYWSRKEAGPSALLLYLGVEGKISELEHHTLLFVDDWKKNFDAIYSTKELPKKASIYISKTSGIDATVAPSGNENIFVLVPLPAGINLTAKQTTELTKRYLDQIKEMTGVDIESRIIVKEVFGPNDFATKFYAWQSSMLGQSHLLRQSAFFRSPNISKKVKNLYYVGGNTTPGIGLPMCLIGAELIYKRLAGDRRGGRVRTIKKLQGDQVR
jgi:phytoene desaturase